MTATAVTMTVLIAATGGVVAGPRDGAWPETFGSVIIACVILLPMCMFYDATVV